jgi:ABC-type multidrug transport system fused ATPase/permease subunit
MLLLHAGQRQTARLRQRYLEAALMQDITFYDRDFTTGDILSGLNDDCTSVQNAISEKVCKLQVPCLLSSYSEAWRRAEVLFTCFLCGSAC